MMEMSRSHLWLLDDAEYGTNGGSMLSATSPAFVPAAAAEKTAPRSLWLTKAQRQALKQALVTAGRYVAVPDVVRASNAAVLRARRVKPLRLLPDDGDCAAVRAYIAHKVCAQAAWVASTGQVLTLPIPDDPRPPRARWERRLTVDDEVDTGCRMHHGAHVCGAGGVWDVRADTGSVRFAACRRERAQAAAAAAAPASSAWGVLARRVTEVAACNALRHDY